MYLLWGEEVQWRLLYYAGFFLSLWDNFKLWQDSEHSLLELIHLGKAITETHRTASLRICRLEGKSHFDPDKDSQPLMLADTESQSSWGWERRLEMVSPQPSAQSRVSCSRVLKPTWAWVLTISMDGDSTAPANDKSQGVRLEQSQGTARADCSLQEGSLELSVALQLAGLGLSPGTAAGTDPEIAMWVCGDKAGLRTSKDGSLRAGIQASG